MDENNTNPITSTKQVVSKWQENMINYTSLTAWPANKFIP
jgi:hypothetical protein